jgi:7,8-dihydropterin-6-yl-methyl-4-(beta-D-ribofuranosyl)aminobenzene 5'-phosphate synthase
MKFDEAKMMSCHKRFILLVGWALIAGLILAACGPTVPLTPAATPTPLVATRVPPANTPLPAAGGLTGDLTITIIYDNAAHDARLQADWGFAALIQYGGHMVLFDTGASGQMLVSNMDKLGIDPRRIEAIVLSHAHEDHVNGLQALLNTGVTPTVYVLPSFDSSFKNSVRVRTNLVEVNGPLEILPGLHSTGGLGTSIVEQALVVEMGQGIVVITGCAHPGIVSIVSQAKKMAKGDVALLVGGFHLLETSPSQVKQIIADLRALGVRQISPTHCTGEAAIATFAVEYGDGYVQGGAGRVIKVAQKGK